ncbi:MAG TPA: hypothetical protein VGY54_25130 [Polyangiaceae bacterium]|jgi:hypothetical protein|nr:hypothetical protein [Polyangiaceae bacterium]
MSSKDAITRFRELHERHKRGLLASDEVAEYGALRDDFYNALQRAQRLGSQPGQQARQAVRVPRAMKIELAVAGKQESTMTYDVGVAGFGALVREELPVGSPCEFILTAAGHPLRGQARVRGCVRHGSGGVTHRASFALEAMSDGDRTRLEIAVVDAALATLAALAG